MAVATATSAINMNDWTFFESTSYTIANGTHIQEVASGGEVVDYYGSFIYDAGGALIAGMLDRVTQTTGAALYDVTGLNHDAVLVNTYIQQMDEDALFSYLFSGKDTFTGSAGPDQLNGYGGNDKMDGKRGSDKINGGSGNDTLIYGAGDRLNGAAGSQDKLKIKVGSLDLSDDIANPNSRLLNFEQVDMRGDAHTLKLSKADVLDMSSTSTIQILGDLGDTVRIVGTQVAGGTAPEGFTRYTIGSAILNIDSDVIVM